MKKLEKNKWKIFKKNNIKNIDQYYYDNMMRLKNKNLKYFIMDKIHNNSKLKNILQRALDYKYRFDFLVTNKASIAMLDFIITTKCTLNCEQCSSMMPFYSKDTHYSETFETFKNNLDYLLKSVNKVYRFHLIGGEPLLNKELPKMFEYAARKKQLVEVQIVTNSTLLPSNELINVMKKYKHKCTVAISDYTSNPNLKNLKLKEVLNMFLNAGIVAYAVDYDWFTRGDIKKENRTTEELKNVMSSCWQHNCTAYCNGELHICSRSIAIKRNLNPDLQHFVKMTADKNSSKEVIDLFCREYVDACDYCHTRCDIRIPRGAQIEREKESNCAAAQD